MVTYFLNDEMPMNEPIDENEQAFVSTSGTCHVYPTWDAKEVASLTKSCLTLDYRKDPGFKAGEAFALRRTD
jgi:hypothetical protein